MSDDEAGVMGCRAAIGMGARWDAGLLALTEVHGKRAMAEVLRRVYSYTP
jgi:hypothetical protein